MSEQPSAVIKGARVRLEGVRRYCATRTPGILFCLLLVAGSLFLAERYSSSTILGAFLIGMAFNSISRFGEMSAGIDFCAREVLRFGVVLLGVRLTFAQIAQLGVQPVLVAVTVVMATLTVSVIIARAMKIDSDNAWISGAAVGICGVSAALAVSAALRPSRASEIHLACTVAGVAGLSSLCMMVYPGLLLMLDWTPEQMGLFLGATIHDIAQVVGAGEMVSTEVTQLAAYTKMLRVAALLPVIVVTVLIFRRCGATPGRLTTYFPPFLLGFLAMALAANTGLIPGPVVGTFERLSQACMWTAMAALGTKTNLVDLWLLGRRPLVLLLINTAFIGVLAFILIR